MYCALAAPIELPPEFASNQPVNVYPARVGAVVSLSFQDEVADVTPVAVPPFAS